MTLTKCSCEGDVPLSSGISAPLLIGMRTPLESVGREGLPTTRGHNCFLVNYGLLTDV
jgi:hypothetical protein